MAPRKALRRSAGEGAVRPAKPSVPWARGQKKARWIPGFKRIPETGVSRGSKETTGAWSARARRVIGLSGFSRTVV